MDTTVALFERRFLKNAFLPVLLFSPAVAGPVLLQDGRLEVLVKSWDAQSATLKLVEAIGYLAVVWFVAAIVGSQWYRLTQLLEGIYVGWLGPVRERAVAWHSARRAALEVAARHDAEASVLLHDRYPQADKVLPTRLGNILRAAEEYPADRYGFPLITLWSRLYRVLPSEFADNLEDVRARMEFLLVISAWCVGFAFCSLALGIAFASSPLVVAWCFIAGMALAYAAYLSALPEAIEYGDRLKAAYELYRFDLFEGLRFRQPSTIKEEARLWLHFVDFVVKGDRIPVSWQRHWMYQEPPAPRAAIEVLVRAEPE